MQKSRRRSFRGLSNISQTKKNCTYSFVQVSDSSVFYKNSTKKAMAFLVELVEISGIEPLTS